MEIPYKKQSQFELFPGAASGASPLQGSHHFLREFTLPPENTLLLCIILLMAFLLCFSFGVERGKRVQPLQAAPAEKITLQNKNNAIIAPSSKPGTLTTTAKVNTAPINAASNVSQKVGSAVTTQPPAVVQPVETFNYTIQVASYKQASFAQQEADKLKNSGLNAFVIAKGNYSIVCVGKFMQTAEAKKQASRLKNRYKDLLIRSL